MKLDSSTEHRIKNLKTNEELISDLMNFSPYGALCQGFIMQALGDFCKRVITDKEELIEKEKQDVKDGKISIISNGAWVGIAEDIDAKMNCFYNRS